MCPETVHKLLCQVFIFPKRQWWDCYAGLLFGRWRKPESWRGKLGSCNWFILQPWRCRLLFPPFYTYLSLNFQSLNRGPENGYLCTSPTLLCWENLTGILAGRPGMASFAHRYLQPWRVLLSLCLFIEKQNLGPKTFRATIWWSWIGQIGRASW